ncbi:MAG: hypothetical protein GKS02_09010 [Alphaproteobacteria bacterium]|nr:hypothetical protein [Alphaproteobacteria bacterium]
MTTFFVGGAQRSGTTLLQGLLCSSEKTNPLIYECFLLQHIVDAYRRGRNNFAEFGPAYFTDIPAFQSFYRRVVADYLDQTRARYAPAEHLVLKETNLTRVFHDVYDLVPNAKYIISVRDPRDVIASLIEVAEKLPKPNTNRWFAERNMKRLAGYYKGFYRSVLVAPDANFRKNLLFVKHEALVTNPAREVARISEFTDFPLAPEDGTAAWKRNEWDFDDMERFKITGWRSELWGKEMSTKNIGKFRGKLTAEELAILDEELADVYIIFGYGDDDVSASTATFAAPHQVTPTVQL